ncbi:MAG: hypothetical protein M1499_06345 [Firmicutes bacterium]|nr:hypothetical protein [Bacillota bacterium]
MNYTSRIEAETCEFWPGTTPWQDQWGSLGSYPGRYGYGGCIERVRIPRENLIEWWDWVEDHYVVWPAVKVSPRETQGLADWLESKGYQRAESQDLMVQDRQSSWQDGFSPLVVEPSTLAQLSQVYQLDNQVFADPLPTMAEMAEHLVRLKSGHRHQFCLLGEAGVAITAGGLTAFSGWGLLWGGETHPTYRGRGFYHVMVRHRLWFAYLHNCDFVAVYATKETSQPILANMGFSVVETVDIFRPPVHRQYPRK